MVFSFLTFMVDYTMNLMSGPVMNVRSVRSKSTKELLILQRMIKNHIFFLIHIFHFWYYAKWICDFICRIFYNFAKANKGFNDTITLCPRTPLAATSAAFSATAILMSLIAPWLVTTLFSHFFELSKFLFGCWENGGKKKKIMDFFFYWFSNK